MKTHQGREIDISTIMAQNSKVIAAGNMKVNARGDLIGRKGKILKTKEQLENEYFKAYPDAAKEKSVGLNREFEEFKNRIIAKDVVATDNEVQNDPFKTTTAVNPNLNTNKDAKVKFVDLIKPKETENVAALDEVESIGFDDDEQFELSDTSAKKSGRKEKN